MEFILQPGFIEFIIINIIIWSVILITGKNK
jgi:hypothetical protein